MSKTKPMNGQPSTPKNLTTTIAILTTVEDAGGWIIVGDSFGDWRGTNEALGLRTRLKRDTRGEGARSGLDWVRHDITIRRLQRFDGGQWIDKIDKAAHAMTQNTAAHRTEAT